MERASPRSEYIAEIDGLRAIAVTAVILSHLSPQLLPGGFVGVDIFFVVSGYVVARSLADHNVLRPLAFVAGFYARRFVRILPALLVCIVATAGLTIAFVPETWLSEATSITGRYALFGASNVALIQTTDGYFSPRTEFNPFAHTWSLGVEEQFYLVFPILFFIYLRRNQLPNWLRGIAASAVMVLGLASLAVAAWATFHSPIEAYYSLPTRFWELAAGAGLYQVHFVSNRRLSPRAATMLVTAGAVALITAFFAITPTAPFPFPWALLPVAGTVLFLHAANIGPERLPGMRALRWALVLAIGRASYSLYLWHWPTFSLLRWTVGLESPMTQLVALAVTGALGAISYLLVETPIRAAGRHYLPRLSSAVVIVSAVAIAVSYYGYGVAMRHRSDWTLTVTADRKMWSPDNFPGTTEQPGLRPTLFAVGDSHLFAYSSMLQYAAQKEGFRLRTFYSTCQIANIQFPRNHSPECDQIITGIFDAIEREAGPGDLVFFPSLRMPRLTELWSRYDLATVQRHINSSQFAGQLAAAVDDTEGLLDKLRDRSVVFVLDAPKPVFAAPPFRCSDWFNRMNPICSGGFTVARNVLLDLREPMMRALRELQSGHPDIVVWDPFPYLCPQDPCSAFDSTGRPLFFDGDHLSGYGNEVLIPPFQQLLQQLSSRNGG